MALGVDSALSENEYQEHFLVTASVVWWLACWSLVPEFAGSIPTEAVGFFSFLRK
jgi:hypothetical protein